LYPTNVKRTFLQSDAKSDARRSVPSFDLEKCKWDQGKSTLTKQCITMV